MPIKGLIFDFDGLILDTETIEYQAWKEIYHHYHTDLPLSEWVKVIGTDFNAFNPYQYLEERTGAAVNRSKIKAEQNRRVSDLVLEAKTLPGVREMLENARSMGLKLGLASSSYRDKILAHLIRLGLEAYFDAICTGDQVDRVKPDPMLYQCALNELELEPENVIAFEDSPNGITAAKAAGLFCVAVPGGLTGHLDVSHADLIVSSLDELPLGQLLEEVCQ